MPLSTISKTELSILDAAVLLDKSGLYYQNHHTLHTFMAVYCRFQAVLPFGGKIVLTEFAVKHQKNNWSVSADLHSSYTLIATGKEIKLLDKEPSFSKGANYRILRFNGFDSIPWDELLDMIETMG